MIQQPDESESAETGQSPAHRLRSPAHRRAEAQATSGAAGPAPRRAGRRRVKPEAEPPDQPVSGNHQWN